MRDADYRTLLGQADALTADVPYPVANLANLAALLWASLEEINWVGFYLRQGQTLVLGPFQGNPACVTIPWGRGVCGTAAAKDETQLVPDVHRFPGHIACDSASRSEIVIPLCQGGAVRAVLDIDSPFLSRFGAEEKEGLERFAAALADVIRFDD